MTFRKRGLLLARLRDILWPKTETECFCSKYLHTRGSNKLPHVQAAFLCIDAGCIVFWSKLFGVSKGEVPVRIEISDAPILSCLALTQSALFCFNPVFLDLRKAINT